MSRLTALCLMCGLLAVSCVSAVPRSEEIVEEVMDVIKEWVTPSVKAEPSAFAPFLGAEDERFHIIVKFMVPPMHHKDFAKKWLDMRPHMEGQHGNKKLGLYKIYGDTTVLMSYQEWESRKAFYDHFKLKDVKPVIDFIKEKDITMYLSSMCPVEESSRRAAAGAPSDSSAFDVGSFTTLEQHMMEPEALEAALAAGSEEYTPVLLSKICVRPSKHDDFTGTFLDIKQRMMEEEKKGVEAICLAKTHHDNVCFLGYEEWESMDKLRQHFKSGVHKDWMRFVHGNNIASKVCWAVEIKDMSPFDY